MARAFLNSARKLYLSDSAATPVYTHVPTISIDETPEVKEDKFFSTDGVSAGVAFEDGIVTGHGKTFAVVTKMYKTADATPALVTALASIKACRDKAAGDTELNFVLVEPDGTKVSMLCSVSDVTLIRGGTEDSGALEFKLTRRGAPGIYSGTLT